jgi:hypothetical protein
MSQGDVMRAHPFLSFDAHIEPFDDGKGLADD